MADLEWEGRPEPATLRRAIRHQLRRFDPTIRVIAEKFLADTSPIDLLAVGGEGEVISIRIADEGDDMALLTESLADLSWLRPRLEDFLKLSPGLGIEPSREPRVILLCADFSRATRAAVENLPTRSVELLKFHCVRKQGQLAVLFEGWTPSREQSIARGTAGGSEDRRTPSRHNRRLAKPPNPSGFRTGLIDADLCIEAEEEKILD